MYFAGEALNRTDRLLNGVRDPAARARLIVTLEPPSPELEPDSALARFDIVLATGGAKPQSI
jgi:protocatechuate 3,4-dioxygenase beta subunit